jgi:hypothetical protein
MSMDCGVAAQCGRGPMCALRAPSLVLLRLRRTAARLLRVLYSRERPENGERKNKGDSFADRSDIERESPGGRLRLRPPPAT